MIIIVMGVTGAGKSTVGAALAQRLGCDFVDADDYHSPENIKKMAAGHPLTDGDRRPWLETLHGVLTAYFSGKKNVVLACSALRQHYRDILNAGLPIVWVYLKSSEAEIRDRLTHRRGHFAKAQLLRSQLETLEEPTDAIMVPVDDDPAHTVEYILARLPKANTRPASGTSSGA